MALAAHPYDGQAGVASGLSRNGRCALQPSLHANFGHARRVFERIFEDEAGHRNQRMVDAFRVRIAGVNVEMDGRPKAPGFGPFATWRGRGAGALLKQLRLPLLTSLLLGALLSFAYLHSLLAALSLSLGLWVLLATFWHISHSLQRPAGSSVSWATRWGQTTRSQWGMWLAHGGLAVFVLGVSLVKSLEQSQEASLQPGQTLHLGGYEFRFESIERRKGPNFIAAQARFEVRREGKLVATLRPEKRFYPVQQMPMTEAAIDRSFSRDLYLSLGERSSGGSYGLRVQIKPFMTWIWSGCLFMALGGALAASDRRYRRVAVTVSQKTQPSGSLEAA